MSFSSTIDTKTQDVTLSVVVIARNEEANIGRCIESVLKGMGRYRAEIIFVDSTSTDKTVEIASRYPITILQLDPGTDVSPSAGRFVGAQHARGAFILFLDGDMILIEEWLDAAMQVMEDPSIAAVGGRLFRVSPGEELNRNHPDRGSLGSVTSLAGAALYRADAFAASGGFNPFVKGEEERELGYRIASKGYAMLRMDMPMVYHMNKHQSVLEMDEKAGHFQGVGQIFRAYAGSEIASVLLHRHGKAILSALMSVAALCFVSLLVLVSGALVRIAVLGMGIWGLSWLKIRGHLWKLPLALRFRVLLLFNLLRGWLRGVPAPSEFKVSVSVVKRQAGVDSRL